MEILVREALYADKVETCHVEGLSTPRLRYVERLWDEFAESKGDLSIALIDEKIVGLGKLSVLPDGSAWLETLRVDSAYQGRGVGKAIYRRFLEQADDFGIDTLRMYTGVRNDTSAGLAKINGFKLAGIYTGVNLDVTATKKPENTAAFRQLSPEKAKHHLAKRIKNWDDFIVFNRTFYKNGDCTYKAFADEDKVYYDEKTDSILLLGARFMPERGLNIGMFDGDVKACLDFALENAHNTGVDKVTITIPHHCEQAINDSIAYGYVKESNDVIVMECKR